VRKRLGVPDEKPKERQPSLFGDFNGIEDFAQKVDFYQHNQHWSNRMILGDSLLVMTSLAEKEGLKGQVQMIYIDPPYGIKFGSNWQVSTRKRDVKDGSVADATRQPEQVRAFRDTWELGIHSYLAYLRDRLIAARDLLTDSGSIFVQIGDENVHLVRMLLDEVFGSECFQAQINFKSMGALGQSGLAKTYDYLIWYSRSSETKPKFRPLFREQVFEGDPEYRFVNSEESRLGYDKLARDAELPPGYDGLFRRSTLTSSGYTESCTFPFQLRGNSYSPFSNKSWRTNADGMDRLCLAERIFVLGGNPYFKRYARDFNVIPIENSWTDAPPAFKRRYVVETATKFIERCILMTTDPGDLVLDPTCGSGTTASVAERCGRRWITIDTSRVAMALARTRMMSERYPFYVLADTDAGQKLEAEVTGRTPPPHRTDSDVKKGFVYHRVPHIMLSHIAKNEEIDHIHDKWQQQLEPLREKLNKARKQTWEEWEVPREPGDDWSKPDQKLLAEWWELRRKRQQEIDGSIARNADQELLYDQPYEDKSIVRVTGPFTVESLSPHRQLSVAQKKQRADGVDGLSVRNLGPDQFGNMIIDNLRKAGIQNRIKDERLKFDSLEPWPGEWIHATGEYTDKADEVRKVAVCIGPEHGTVGKGLVKEAAKEAVKGVGYDLLVICGFAFDPSVDEEATQYGKLEVQMCRMNPDLSMGDELLKKTGAGNLFMIFGEPDVRIEKTDDGQIEVEIFGVDVYDPTTGEIRSDSTDDVACWFIDTDYDSESFFVRHAYFTGADDPYKKLKKALKAEIDEAAWSELYSTRSMPFDRPSSGKIAVKVINHYGDEVLKVYEV
ncbi:MAG: site-specific DNA-methyltransferase, partial [Rhodopirellula sp.]|nr:site-specific DNA-methyltransferase [Rhodopirellula sp.]